MTSTPPATVPVFDHLRASVTPGAHVVARFPGVLMVIRREPGGRVAEEAVPALVRICQEVTAAAPRSPGRALARRLTGWLAQNEQAPGFGTLAATDDGVAVFLYGDVTAWAEGLELAGSAAGFTVDRLVDWPAGPLMLAADGISIAEDAGPDWLGLQRGVVEGGGTTLHPMAGPGWGSAPPVAAAPALPPMPMPMPVPMATPVPAPLPETELALPVAAPAPPDAEVSGVLAPPPPPVVFDKIAGVAPDEAPRAPLPVAHAAPVGPPAPQPSGPRGRPPAPPTGFVPSPPATEGVVVLGYRCSRGHLNDPRVSFCAHCGIRMDQLTGVLVKGRRPPLGLVVLDTGSTFVLDDDYLLGRDPENDPEVRDGRLRPLRLDDNSGTMSRAHLEIRLQGWDVAVVDRGSANGTYVAAPGTQGWSAVVPAQPFVLRAGTQVGIGRRTFTFESPHGRL